MKRTLKNILAVAMLSVFMPMAVLLPFHHHDEHEHEQNFECQECEHHLPHPGHVSEDFHLHDCIFCQVQGIHYLPGLEQIRCCSAYYCCFIEAVQYSFVPEQYKLPASQRAPPVTFC